MIGIQTRTGSACFLLCLLITSAFGKECCCDEDNESGSWCTTSTLVTIGAGVGAVAAAPVVLTAAGFGTAGVVAGSIAAKTMSALGVVQSGSVFAGLQSAGAAGIGLATKAGIFGAGAVTGKMLGPNCDKPCTCK